MKKYKLKPSKKQLKIFQKFWKEHNKIRNEFYGKEYTLEKEMNKKFNDLGTLEFFNCDGECVGIGNVERSMKLLQRDKLEK